MTAALLFFAMLIAGLLVYLLASNAKAVRIGEMLLFAGILGMAIALAPAAMAKLLH